MGSDVELLKVGIAFISHDASLRKNRALELEKHLRRIVSQSESVVISSWKLILWQPKQYEIKRKRYFQLLRFRVRASREWGG